MDVIAQWVRVKWTKESRGGPGAARRNAVPEAFGLPSVRAPLTHTVVLDERDGFAPVETFDYVLPDPEDVRLTRVDGRLRVQLVARSGAPKRTHRPTIWLERGEWARWQINYRFSGYSIEWTYRLDTLNIAYGDVKPGAFTDSVPDRYVDERARLR